MQWGFKLQQMFLVLIFLFFFFNHFFHVQCFRKDNKYTSKFNHVIMHFITEHTDCSMPLIIYKSKYFIPWTALIHNNNQKINSWFFVILFLPFFFLWLLKEYKWKKIWMVFEQQQVQQISILSAEVKLAVFFFFDFYYRTWLLDLFRAAFFHYLIFGTISSNWKNGKQ